MSYNGPSIALQTEQAQIENALHYVAQMIDLEGGEVYLPIFENLEAELAKLTSRETAIERARRMARARREAAGS